MVTIKWLAFLDDTLRGPISTVYVSPGFTPYSVTFVLLTVIGDWSELTLCVIINEESIALSVLLTCTKSKV